jgi:hypothetical protein
LAEALAFFSAGPATVTSYSSNLQDKSVPLGLSLLHFKASKSTSLAGSVAFVELDPLPAVAFPSAFFSSTGFADSGSSFF